MGNAKELLLQAVAGILFCVAITLLFHQVSEYDRALAIVKHSYQNQQTVSMEPNKYSSEIHSAMKNQVSYGELIASLCDSLEYDVEINGSLIRKYEHTPDKIDDYCISMQSYQKSYAYDSSGEITKIIYQSNP